ncbi:MAG: 3-oxoacyl-[acyl-carrier protein] reductase [Solirubrobacteraceae bacterium]
MTHRHLSLEGRVAIVTGAARGLGRAQAVALARRGADVVAVDVLDASATLEAIEGIGRLATQLKADLARPDEVEAAVDSVVRARGDLHVLVNNAGLVRDRMSFNLSREDWERVVAVNLSATFYLARAAIRHWRSHRADHDAQPRVIVNTSSESGLYGNAGQANYAAAKAGVAALTITLATELARYGIRVNAIAPRARTLMSDAAFGELPRTASFDPFAPEHVAAVVAWLASDAARDVTGQVLVVHGSGIELMQPWSARRRLARQGEWTDVELLGLREQLFPDGDTRQLAAPVGELFVSSRERRETIGDLGRR